MVKLSKRIQRVEPSPTLAITAKANAMKAEGIDVIGFSAGEPDFDTPEPIARAAREAIASGKTRYTPASGLPDLRKAIAKDYARRQREVAADQVVVTVGAKQALYNATQVLFDPGDKVVIPAPHWVSYPAQLHLAGATPVSLKTGIDSDFKLTPEALGARLDEGDIKGLILCSPSNPTGATYSAEELQGLAEVLEAHPEVKILFDAIYDRLYYEGDIAADLVAQAPTLSERVMTFNGFSKTYAMTGWRLGYAIGPSEWISAMGTLQSQSTSNATTFVQYGGLAALAMDDALLDERRAHFKRRRDLMVQGLNAIDGVDCLTPSGAFYVFPDFSSLIEDGRFEDDLALTETLLTEAHCAVVPGSAFGAPGGLRLSYALGDESIKKGLARIADAL